MSEIEFGLTWRFFRNFDRLSSRMSMATTPLTSPPLEKGMATVTPGRPVVA